jgi:hypothetical protein
MKQLGIYRVSYELLGQFLDLDEDHEVVDVFSSHIERKQNLIGVKVKGPLMYDTPEGTETAWVPLDHLQRMKEQE